MKPFLSIILGVVGLSLLLVGIGIGRLTQVSSTSLSPTGNLDKHRPNERLASNPPAQSQAPAPKVPLPQRQQEIIAKFKMLQPPPSGVAPSPQLAAFLTDKKQLLKDEGDFMKLHQQDDPQTKTEALREWQQQNKTRFDKLQQEARALTQANVTTN